MNKGDELADCNRHINCNHQNLKIKQSNGCKDCICRANDKSASVPVCFGRRVTSSTEITCLEDAIRSQRTHTEYRSPIRANDVGRNPASGCAKRVSANQRLARPSAQDVPTSLLKNHIKGPAHGVQWFSLGLTLEVLSSRLMRRFGTPTSH